MKKPLTIVEHNWEETSIYSPERDYPIATLRIDPDVTEETQDKYEAITRAYAEEIVRAVNSHDELCRVAQAAIHGFKSYYHGNSSHDLAESLIKALETALSKARGEGETA